MSDLTAGPVNNVVDARKLIENYFNYVITNEMKWCEIKSIYF